VSIKITHSFISFSVPPVSFSLLEILFRLACIAHSTDYWHHGRTPVKLGIEQFSVSELLHYVNEGGIRKPLLKRP